MDLISKATLIAMDAHRGEVDKAGLPYILHPLRVAFEMDTEEEKAVAILHDVVEDSDWTIEMLMLEGFPGVVVQAVDVLTRRRNEPYDIYILRTSKNQIAAKVKMGDLKHNLDKSRIPDPKEIDRKRWVKYEDALDLLKELTSLKQSGGK